MLFRFMVVFAPLRLVDPLEICLAITRGLRALSLRLLVLSALVWMKGNSLSRSRLWRCLRNFFTLGCLLFWVVVSSCAMLVLSFWMAFSIWGFLSLFEWYACLRVLEVL